MHLSDLKHRHVTELVEMANALEIEGANRMRKHDLIFALLKNHAKRGESIFGEGVLEILSDGFGFLRSPETSYLSGTDDIYISPSQIRRLNIQTGDTIEGEIRPPKEGERYFALTKVDRINFDSPEVTKQKILFENLIPLHPDEVFRLEKDVRGDENITARIIDIMAPIGKGQRGLLVAPPKSGKTVMLQHIAHSIAANYPDVVLIVLLIDERPEEVTEMQRSVKGEVVSSTFDEPAARHVLDAGPKDGTVRGCLMCATSHPCVAPAGPWPARPSAPSTPPCRRGSSPPSHREPRSVWPVACCATRRRPRSCCRTRRAAGPIAPP